MLVPDGRHDGRVRLDKFTRETWKKFDAKDLEPLKWAILRRRRVLAMQQAVVEVRANPGSAGDRSVGKSVCRSGTIGAQGIGRHVGSYMSRA